MEFLGGVIKKAHTLSQMNAHPGGAVLGPWNDSVYLTLTLASYTIQPNLTC